MTRPLLRSALVALTLLLAAGCGNEEVDPGNLDASVAPGQDGGEGLDAGTPDGSVVCENPCGEECCAQGFLCKEDRCEPVYCETEAEFCLRLGKECGPAEGPDLCGAPRTVEDCNTCAEDEQCGTDGQCICKPEEKEAFCARLGKTCGPVTAPDNCGVEQTFNCGTCTEPAECDLDTNTCVDPCAEPDEAFCGRLNIQCGPASGTDLCGEPRTVENCGGCEAGDRCNELGHCVLCVGETEAELCAAAERVCGAFDAVDRCGATLPIASCGECAAPATCQTNGTCFNLAGNDTCDSARKLAFDATGVAQVRGSTVGATGDTRSTVCSGSGSDVVYTVEVTATSDLEVTLTPDTTGVSWSVYLRSACDLDATEVRCDDNRSNNKLPVTMTARNVKPGTYWLWIDNVSTGDKQPGEFLLDAKLTPSTNIPANDLCSQAAELPFVAGVASVQGDTGLATDGETGSCGVMNGGDLAYQFTLLTESSVSAKVTRDPASPGWRPALYLRSDCTAASEIQCGKETVAVRGAASVTIPRLPAGTYFLIVDGFQGTWGEFQLDVTLGAPRDPPPHDVCAGARNLEFVDGVARIDGDTTSAFDDYTGTCGAMNGSDLAYAFTLSEPGRVLARLTRDPSTPGFEPTMYLRKADCESVLTEDELACARADYTTGKTAITQELEAGTYHLIVDATNATFGKFSLELLTLPTTINENCQAMTELVFDANGVARAIGSTVGAVNDTKGSCGGGGLSDPDYGLDLAYKFTLTRTKTVEVTVTPDTSVRPVVYLRNTCDNSLSQHELGCSSQGSAGEPTILSLAKVLPGTYYLWIDGSSIPYSFDLEVTATDIPAPPGDTCPGVPLDLSSGTVSVSADNLTANDDYQGSCKGDGLMLGGELVYSFSLTEPRSLTAKITRDKNLNPEFAPILYLRSGSCTATDTASEKLCGGGWLKYDVHEHTLFHPNLPAGDYWIFVDGSAGIEGDKPDWAWGGFTLELTTGTAVENDECANAAPLNLSSGSATVTGDTTIGTHSLPYQSCAGSAKNPDLVWSFELTETKIVTATVAADTGSALRPAVYVRSICDGAHSVLACAATATAGGTATATTVQPLGPGQYFVWVDGTSSTINSGPFTLTVTAADPDPTTVVTNDRCDRAEELVFDDQGYAEVLDATTVNAVDDYQATCISGSGRPYSHGGDVAYRFTLREPRTVNVMVTPKGELVPTVYVRKDCDTPTDVLCVANNANNRSIVGTAYDLEAGTYHVIVDASNSTTGPSNGAFDLFVRHGVPPVNDTCAQANFVDLSSGTAVIEGDTSFATPNHVGTCASNGREVVYAFTLPTDTTLEVEAAGTGWNTTGQAVAWKPNVYVRKSCAQDDELVCSTSIPLTVNRLKAGTYYLFVDSHSTNTQFPAGAHGAFTVTLTASSPSVPLNDACSAAEPLVVIGGKATVNGDTTYAWDDTRSGCEPSSSYPTNGPDVAYLLDLATDSAVKLEVKRDGTSTLVPSVYLRPACEDATRELICSDNKTTTSVSVLEGLVPAGLYYVVVDGVKGTSGPFQLDVSVGPAVYNDTCAGATPLEFIGDTATATGDTTFATNKMSGLSCSGSTTPSGANNPEVVYSFSLREDSVVTATATTTSGTLLPSVYIREQCDVAASQPVGACAGGTADTLTLTQTLTAGDYFLWVDGSGAAGKAGAFTLTVTTSPAPAAPDGDTCATAKELVFDVDGNAMATGNTGEARNRTSGAGHCTGSIAPELFYKFTLAHPRKVTAKVVPDSTAEYAPVLYLRESCEQEDFVNQLFCAKTRTGVTAPEGTFFNLPAGTWYLVVDGARSKPSGGFTLYVSTLPADTSAPANGTCRSPEVLEFTGPTVSVLGSVIDANNDSRANASPNGTNTNDVVYELTTTQTQDIVITVTPAPTSPTYRPVVSIRSDCGSFDGIGGGSASAAGRPATYSRKDLAAGTYFIWVDDAATLPGSEGDFELTVTLTPTNDTCTAPTVLEASVSMPGSTVTAANDHGVGPFTPECATLGSSQPGPDLVYSYTPAVSGPFAVTVTPSATFDPSVWVTSGLPADCGLDALCSAAADAGRDGDPEYLTVNGVAGTTYYIVVDSATAGEVGDFAISVQ